MLASRLEEAEEKMKQALDVVEQQKHASVRKMKQLAMLLRICNNVSRVYPKRRGYKHSQGS